MKIAQRYSHNNNALWVMYEYNEIGMIVSTEKISASEVRNENQQIIVVPAVSVTEEMYNVIEKWVEK